LKVSKFQRHWNSETWNFETCRGAVAQLGERLVCNQEATGSIPVSSTKDSLEWQSTGKDRRVTYFIDRFFALGGLLVPISAIIVGGAIAITAMIIRHNERIAKIERGIDPDASPQQQR
jgi:hypothetical protein